MTVAERGDQGAQPDPKVGAGPENTHSKPTPACPGPGRDGRVTTDHADRLAFPSCGHVTAPRPGQLGTVIGRATGRTSRAKPRASGSRGRGGGSRDAPGQRGSLPAKQSPRVWLAKVEGPDGLCSNSKRDLASGRS